LAPAQSDNALDFYPILRLKFGREKLQWLSGWLRYIHGSVHNISITICYTALCYLPDPRYSPYALEL